LTGAGEAGYGGIVQARRSPDVVSAAGVSTPLGVRMQSRCVFLSIAIGAVGPAATSAPASAAFPGPSGRIALASDTTEDCADDPPVEQPAALVAALHTALELKETA
jgi:hypothetical protein